MAVITISRQIGSLGDELAGYLASRLGCDVITRDALFDRCFENLDGNVRSQLAESTKFFLRESAPGGPTYKQMMCDYLCRLADNSANLIILGLGACIALEGRPDIISVRMTAGNDVRTKRISRRFNISLSEAESIITIGDRKHKRFVSTLYDKDLNDPSLYALTFNTDYLSVEECAESVMALLARKKNRLQITEETRESEVADHQSDVPVFKNDTEAEFARILDMYNVEWMYEPKTFPIEWDSEGNVTMAFSPDFYLPRFNLYLELTTMEQKYVTKKNKKARRVMELYPGTNVRIVYKKDFLELVQRFKMLGG